MAVTNYDPKFSSSVAANESNTSTPKFSLGYEVADREGNKFRYVKFNEAVTVGQVVTQVAQAAWDATIVMDGAVTSGNKIHVDTVTTAVDADHYKGYIIKQAAAASKGYGYKIVSHGALAASGEGDVYVEPNVGETLADGAVLYAYHPNLVELTDAATEAIEGVAITDITSGYYGFIQVDGPCCKAVAVGHTTSAAIVLNEPLLPIAANAGSVQGFAGTGEADIVEASLTKLIALEAVAADTAGFIMARFR